MSMKSDGSPEEIRTPVEGFQDLARAMLIYELKAPSHERKNCLSAILKWLSRSNNK